MVLEYWIPFENINGVTMKASGWKIKTQSGTEKGETSAVEGFHWIPKESWKENVEIPSLHEFNPEIFERERK